MSAQKKWEGKSTHSKKYNPHNNSENEHQAGCPFCCPTLMMRGRRQLSLSTMRVRTDGRNVELDII